MSTMVPKTPEQTPRKAGLNRSSAAANAPHRGQPTAEIGATEGVETLFTHPSGKIVKFTSNAPTRPSTSSGTWTPGGSEQGTLPWATLTEKTMAAGPLEIYCVPGSVSFLHSGSLLHAILPRSNCWCVDGVSKFAMRVLPDTYYRIELPGDTPEELARVETFKVTLRKVLFYERTPCPFVRTFTVDLPEEGDPRPTRRRRRATDGPAKKWKLDKAYSWKPEGWTPNQGGPSSDSSSSSATASDEDGSPGSPDEDAEEPRGELKKLNSATPSPARTPSVRDRARGIDLRSVTAPAQLYSQFTPPSRLRASLLAGAAAQPRPVWRLSSPEARRSENRVGREEESSCGQDDTAHNSTLTDVTRTAVGLHEGVTPSQDSGSLRVGSSQWESEPDPYETAPVDVTSTRSAPPEVSKGAEGNSARGPADIQSCDSSGDYQVESQVTAGVTLEASLPEAHHDGDTVLHATCTQPLIRERCPGETSGGDGGGGGGHESRDAPPEVDAFAAIQAKIQARRSISGTAASALNSSTMARLSRKTSTASSTSLHSQFLRRSPSKMEKDQALAPALVRKAASAFLGPPVHLVAIMLKIAARFAAGAFPRAFIFESPPGMPKRVPGSFDLDDHDIADELASGDDLDEDDDDFGVPLGGAMRRASRESLARVVVESNLGARMGG